MVKCSFCKSDIMPGTGKLYILKEGKILPLCSNKCEKNMFKLHRNAAKLKWANPEK